METAEVVSKHLQIKEDKKFRRREKRIFSLLGDFGECELVSY